MITVKSYSDALKLNDQITQAGLDPSTNRQISDLSKQIAFVEKERATAQADDVARLESEAVRLASKFAENWNGAYNTDLSRLQNEGANIANRTDVSGLDPNKASSLLAEEKARTDAYNSSIADFNKNYNLFGFSPFQAPTLQKGANGYIEQVNAAGNPVSAAVNGGNSSAPANMGNTGQGLKITQGANGMFQVVGVDGKVYGEYKTQAEALSGQQTIQGGSTPGQAPQGTTTSPVYLDGPTFTSLQGKLTEADLVRENGKIFLKPGLTVEQVAARTAAGASSGSSLPGPSVDVPSTLDSGTLNNSFTLPKTNADIENLINEQRKMQDAYFQALQPSQKQLELEASLADIRQQIDAKLQSLQAGKDKITDQTIPMEFITGQNASLDRTAQRQLENLNAIENNLLTRLGLEQNDQKMRQDAAAAQMGFAQDNLDLAWKIQDRIQADEDRVLAQADRLSAAAKDNLSMFLDMFQGLDFTDLSPQEQATISSLAGTAGVPIDLLSKGMETIKNQMIAEQLRKAKGSGGSTEDKEIAKFRADAADYINKLDSGKITWGAAWDSLRVLYPSASPELLDATLGGGLDPSTNTYYGRGTIDQVINP